MSAVPAATGSIRRRLTLMLAAIAAALAAAFFLILRAVALETAEETQDAILVAAATAIADTLRVEAGEITLDLPHSALSMLGAIAEERVFYRVLAEGGTLTGYDDLPLPESRRAGGPEIATLAFRGGDVRAAAITRQVSDGEAGRAVTVVVAQSRGYIAALLARISALAALLGAGAFAVASVLGALAVRGALTPLERLTASLGRRGPGDLSPLAAASATELAPLVAALNGLMGRLSAALSRSEEMIGEAAHRIRTPLATLRAEAELAHARVERPENRAALRTMLRAIDESARSAGQILDHAMVSVGAEPMEPAPVDLARIAADTAARLGPTAELRDIALGLDADQAAEIAGDAILLQNAVHNVLDNAIKYAPEDSTVTLSVTAAGAEARLSVTDEGPGFVREDRARLTARFARGAGAGGVVGSGLGLTIAEEVARAHHGHLTLGDNPDGRGACVSLVLPRFSR